MAEQEPVTQTIDASQVRSEWSALLDQVSHRETRVVVEQSGIPVAAIISAADLERLTRIDADRGHRFRALDRAWATFRDVPPEEIEREVAQAIQRVRAANRAESGPPNALP